MELFFSASVCDHWLTPIVSQLEMIVRQSVNKYHPNPMVHDDDTCELDDLSNREILQILLDEIADVRRELKEDISEVHNRIDGVDKRLDGVDKRLDGVDKNLGSLNTKFNTLNMKVDRNHLTFMHHIEHYDKRITVLEAA